MERIINNSCICKESNFSKIIQEFEKESYNQKCFTKAITELDKSCADGLIVKRR
jgi:hypothetical protein